MTSTTSSSSSTVTARASYNASSSTTLTPRPNPPISPSSHPQLPPPAQDPSPGRFPVTPALLRSIFASSRTPFEERSISRVAFFRFAGFLLSCVAISFAAARGRSVGTSVRAGAGLLGVV